MIQMLSRMLHAPEYVPAGAVCTRTLTMSNGLCESDTHFATPRDVLADEDLRYTAKCSFCVSAVLQCSRTRERVFDLLWQMRHDAVGWAAAPSLYVISWCISHVLQFPLTKRPLCFERWAGLTDVIPDPPRVR